MELKHLVWGIAAVAVTVLSGAVLDAILCREPAASADVNPAIQLFNQVAAGSMSAACRLAPWR